MTKRTVTEKESMDVKSGFCMRLEKTTTDYMKEIGGMTPEEIEHSLCAFFAKAICLNLKAEAKTFGFDMHPTMVQQRAMLQAHKIYSFLEQMLQDEEFASLDDVTITEIGGKAND